jgi:type I restriction enzyme S subunit
MNVPKLRFKEFNDKYNITKVSEIIDVIDGDRGNNYPKANDFYDSEFCLFLNAGNVTKNGFNFKNNQFITKEKDKKLRKGKLLINDVVLTTRGTVGNVTWFNEKTPYKNIRINSGMVINRIKENGHLLPEYLYSYMKSPVFENQVNKMNYGSAQPQLTVSGINKFNIQYPTINEQKKVSTIMLLLDKKIELQSKKIEDLKLFKLYLQNKLYNANDTKDVLIKDLGEIVTGTTPSKSENKYWDNGNILWITPTDICENRDINDCSCKLTESGLAKGRFIPKNSILVTCIASIGKNAIIKEDGSCNQQINAIIPSKDYNYNYIYYMIENLSNYMKSIAGTSATAIINKEQFGNINIKIHKREVQDKISKILNAFETKIIQEGFKYKKLQNLKKGLMQNMFV